MVHVRTSYDDDDKDETHFISTPFWDSSPSAKFGLGVQRRSKKKGTGRSPNIRRIPYPKMYCKYPKMYLQS